MQGTHLYSRAASRTIRSGGFACFAARCGKDALKVFLNLVAFWHLPREPLALIPAINMFLHNVSMMFARAMRNFADEIVLMDVEGGFGMGEMVASIVPVIYARLRRG